MAGIGNMWMSEALWAARVSPWLSATRGDEDARAAVVEAAATLMRGSRPGAAPGLPTCGDRLSPLRRHHPLPRPGRRQPHRVLVPGLPAQEEGRGPPRNRPRWRCALRTSTRPSAGSVSGRSSCSAASSRRGPSCPSPSRSTRSAGRRSTSTARSCARSSRSAPRAGAPGRALLALEELRREPAAAIFARAHAGPRPARSRRSSGPCCSRS